jgi:hypothetical protein
VTCFSGEVISALENIEAIRAYNLRFGHAFGIRILGEYWRVEKSHGHSARRARHNRDPEVVENGPAILSSMYAVHLSSTCLFDLVIRGLKRVEIPWLKSLTLDQGSDWVDVEADGMCPQLQSLHRCNA